MARSNADCLRNLREKAAAIGRCSCCRKNYARPALRTCVECAAKDRRTHVNQAFYRECCQSSDEHRFDCADVPREKRGPGPFGPVTKPSAAELIAAMRREATDAA